MRYFDDKANPPGSPFRSRFTEAEWRAGQRAERREALFQVGMVIFFFGLVAWVALEVFAGIVNRCALGISN